MKLGVDQSSVTDALRAQSRSHPWGGAQVLGVTTANTVAVVVTLFAWWEASGTGKATEQVGLSSLALVGAVIALASNTWFLARGRQMIRGAQGVVLGDRRLMSYRPDAVAPDTNGTNQYRTRAVAAPGGHHLTVPGTSRYHRPACLLVAGKNTDGATRSAHEQAGRTPCEVCEP